MNDGRWILTRGGVSLDDIVVIDRDDFEFVNRYETRVTCTDCDFDEMFMGKLKNAECPECREDGYVETKEYIVFVSNSVRCVGCSGSFEIYEDFYLDASGGHLCTGCYEDAAD